MNGEIDLELYTLSIIRLNTAFMKLEDNDDDAFALFNQSANDLEEFYQDIIDELNQDEINYNEFYPFFENGKHRFPQYINILEEVNENQNNEDIIRIIDVFKNLHRLALIFLAKTDLII